MPKKYPPEFKRDVVTIARRGDLNGPGVSGVSGHAGAVHNPRSSGPCKALTCAYSVGLTGFEPATP